MSKVFEAPIELTIYTAGQVMSDLVKLYKKHSEITVDLAKTAEIDTAGLQVLLAFKKQGNEDSKTINYINCNHSVDELVKLFGLSSFLMSQSQ